MIMSLYHESVKGETKQESNLFKIGFSFTFNMTFIFFITRSRLCLPHAGTRLTNRKKKITMILCTATSCTYKWRPNSGSHEPPAESLSWHNRRLFRLKPFLPSVSRNGAIIINPLGHFHLSCMSFPFPPAALRIPATTPWAGPPQKSSSSHMSRYTSKASRLQFPSGVNTYLWKVPSTHMAARRREKLQWSHFIENTTCWSEVDVAIWSAKMLCVKQFNSQTFIMASVEVRWCAWFDSWLERKMLHYYAAWMPIRPTASESSWFEVHIIKSLIKNKWYNGPIEAHRQRRSLIWTREWF